MKSGVRSTWQWAKSRSVRPGREGSVRIDARTPRGSYTSCHVFRGRKRPPVGHPHARFLLRHPYARSFKLPVPGREAAGRRDEAAAAAGPSPGGGVRTPSSQPGSTSPRNAADRRTSRGNAPCARRLPGQSNGASTGLGRFALLLTVEPSRRMPGWSCPAASHAFPNQCAVRGPFPDERDLLLGG